MKVKDVKDQLATQMQEMQDMFLSKFKKLKMQNKTLFKKAMKKSGLPGASESEVTDSSPEKANDESFDGANDQETAVLKPT